jgi:hypothetical protein
MLKQLIVTILILAMIPTPGHAQLDTLIFGENAKRLGTNYYNYGDLNKENIEVYVWGGVKNPGVYLIPAGTDLIRLLTLTGGAPDERMYETFKLIRPKTKSGTMSADSAFVFNFDDFFDKSKEGSYKKSNPLLQAGDMLIFPIKPGLGFWEWAGRISGVIILPLLAMLTLILQIATYRNL